MFDVLLTFPHSSLTFAEKAKRHTCLGRLRVAFQISVPIVAACEKDERLPQDLPLVNGQMSNVTRGEKLSARVCFRLTETELERVKERLRGLRKKQRGEAYRAALLRGLESEVRK